MRTFLTIFWGTVADTRDGFIKTTIQHYTDNTVLGKPLEQDKYLEKLVVGAIKDPSNSSVKGTAKMDADVAGKYRNKIVYPMYQVAEAARNPVGAANQMINNMFSTSVIMKAVK